jgi:VanZ family protein
LSIIALMLKWKIFQHKWVAITWLVIMCILFFLPGSAFPSENWLSEIYFDKVVHIGLFAILIFLWRSAFDSQLVKYNLILLLSALFYGLAVEFIQRYFVPNRDFDLYDVVADMIGAIMGLVTWLSYRKK